MINQEFLNIIENTDRTPIFVDLNNLFYRYYYTFSPDKFRTTTDLYSGHLFGLCQTLITLDKLKYEVFLCEDSKCTWRKKINESYKANRKDKTLDFWVDYNVTHDLISNLNHTHCLKSRGFEADDVMYSAAKHCSNLGKDCLIFTTDKDLLQAIDEHINVVHKVSLVEFDIISDKSTYYTSKFPVPPNKLPLYRAFKGDSSDNISPVIKRFPKELMLSIIDYVYENNNLKGFKIVKKSYKHWIDDLVVNWDKLMDNYKLMKLDIIPIELVPKSKCNSHLYVCKRYELFNFMNYCSTLMHNI